MIVTMNNGVRIVLFEIALKSPVVGKAKREQGAGCSYGIERDDISAVVGTSDTHELFARDRMKVGESRWIAGPRSHSCV